MKTIETNILVSEDRTLTLQLPAEMLPGEYHIMMLINEHPLKPTIPTVTPPITKTKIRRSILELRGLGKHLWQEVSVKDYINAERDSWNG